MALDLGTGPIGSDDRRLLSRPDFAPLDASARA